MKKLILSAVFALACFSANAQTTTKVQETPTPKEALPKTTGTSETVRLACPRPWISTYLITIYCGPNNIIYVEGIGLSAYSQEEAQQQAQSQAEAAADSASCP